MSITAMMLLLLIGQVSAKRYLVSTNGIGDGSSWAQALGDLQKALTIATAGDEIWVASGTYWPSKIGDPAVSFRIPSGVALYGGFKGTETVLTERNWQANKTILSGNLGEPNDSSDNSHTIVIFERVAPSTILDGFILINGTAKGFVRGADPVVAGAAIFNNGANGVSSPTIRNCLFRSNYAREGAALYNYASKGKCEPKIINCNFVANVADFNGGAIFNNGDDGVCNPEIINCIFEGNRANYGGSILNSAKAGICNPLIDQSVFVKNFSAMGGSVVYNKLTGNSKIYAIMSACQIKENRSAVGRDVENNDKNSPNAAGMRTSFD